MNLKIVECFQLNNALKPFLSRANPFPVSLALAQLKSVLFRPLYIPLERNWFTNSTLYWPRITWPRKRYFVVGVETKGGEACFDTLQLLFQFFSFVYRSNQCIVIAISIALSSNLTSIFVSFHFLPRLISTRNSFINKEDQSRFQQLDIFFISRLILGMASLTQFIQFLCIFAKAKRIYTPKKLQMVKILKNIIKKNYYLQTSAVLSW